MDTPAKSFVRIGIMGGSFDPIHIGHLKVAEAARSAVKLEKVIFVTAHCPPHKSLQDLTPVEHRQAMVERAIRDRAHFETSRIEAEQNCPTYAGDSIRHYKERLGTAGELFFITGLDALLTIINWDNARTYPGICQFIAAARPGCDLEKIVKNIPQDFLPSITILEEPCLSISSTEIRSRVKAQLPIDGMVPGTVRDYIYRNGLYLN